MTDPEPRRRPRGAEAVEAAIDELDVRSRVDETDPSMAEPAELDLAWASDHTRDPKDRAAADVLHPDEVLDDLAHEVGRELPDEAPDEDR